LVPLHRRVTPFSAPTPVSLLRWCIESFFNWRLVPCTLAHTVFVWWVIILLPRIIVAAVVVALFADLGLMLVRLLTLYCRRRFPSIISLEVVPRGLLKIFIFLQDSSWQWMEFLVLYEHTVRHKFVIPVLRITCVRGAQTHSEFWARFSILL
jgi:hypothetical protein